MGAVDVSWSDVGIIVNLLSIAAAAFVVVLATHLKKYFPGHVEIENKYVDKDTFAREMQKLRDDLHLQLANSSQNTNRLLRNGIRALRQEVNGMSPRIQIAHDRSIAAESLAKGTMEMLGRVESDTGAFRSEIRSLAEGIGGLREDIGYIKGRMTKDA